MAFGYDPYIYINFDAFHWLIKYNRWDHDWEIQHNPDDEARQSSRTKELRQEYGGKCWRYNKLLSSWNPFSGQVVDDVSPARIFHKAHLAWWMSKFQLGGFRLDSINNVANWDFVREFRADAYKHFEALHPDVPAGDHFLVIGEELSMPIDIVKNQNDPPRSRPLAIWNEEFRKRVRAVINGEWWDEDSGTDQDKFGWTVKKMIDCTQLNFGDFTRHFEHGGQAINYITSHDTEGFRQERLWNYLDKVGVADGEGKAQRSKLAFVCLLTSVGIPMILGGDEFCDRGDEPSKHPYKQQDPINWDRLHDDWRRDLFDCVKRLIALRKSSVALTNLAKGSVDFIRSDDTNGYVRAWVRKPASGDDIVAVIANFSDAEVQNNITTWPNTIAGKHWHDVVTDTRADDAGRESLGPWGAKVCKLVDD